MCAVKALVGVIKQAEGEHVDNADRGVPVISYTLLYALNTNYITGLHRQIYARPTVGLPYYVHAFYLEGSRR